jgi:hypothetical protein
MTLRVLALLTLTVLLFSASLALAAAAPATQQPPAAAVAPPFAAPPSDAVVCAATGIPEFLPKPQPAAGSLCGPCSDQACVGKAEFFVCGSGLRCLAQGKCGATTATLCRCLII